MERTTFSVFPQRGYWRRMRVYLGEMYPVCSRMSIAAFLYLGLAGLLRAIHGGYTPHGLRFTAVGIFSLFAMGLIARLMDDLKDKAIDRRLFPERPLPSGRVLESDIAVSLVGVTALYLAANVWAGPALWMALALLVYALLMFRHFFIRATLECSLPLTLATHNPIIPGIYIYVVMLSSLDHGLTWNTLDGGAVALAVLMYWSMSLALEIGRKIRAPEEETPYVTYSQLWGPRIAVLVAAGAQTITLGIGLRFYAALSLSRVYLSILLAAYAIIWWRYSRFLIRPAPETSRLKYAAATFLAMVVFANGLEFTFVR